MSDTPRLRLRAWEAGDDAAYADFYANDPLSRFSGGPMAPDQAWRHLASVIGHWTLRGYGVWAIEEVATGRLCGCGGAWRPGGWDAVEFAFWFTTDIFERDLALEGAKAAFDAVVASHPRETLVAYAPGGHDAYHDILRQLGGTPHDTKKIGGEAYDIYAF